MYVDQPASKLYAEKRKIVILPIGSCEQHGPHLPIDTDLRIAQLIAEKLTKSFTDEQEAILLPAIPFSCSWEHKGLGTLALSTNTISAIIYDVVYSLKNWGMPVFLVLLNWHGGNSILSSLTTEITARENIPTTVISSITLAGHIWERENGPSPDDVHAGALETSIIQAYWPELVAKTDLEDVDFVPNVKPIHAQSIFQALGIYAVSATGVWGNTHLATPEKGRFIIETIIQEIHEQVHSLMELIENKS